MQQKCKANTSSVVMYLAAKSSTCLQEGELWVKGREIFFLHIRSSFFKHRKYIQEQIHVTDRDTRPDQTWCFSDSGHGPHHFLPGLMNTSTHSSTVQRFRRITAETRQRHRFTGSESYDRRKERRREE